MKHISCNDPLCPVCYQKFSCRLAEGVTERLAGYSTIYPDNPIYHIVISPPEGTRFKDLKEAYAAAAPKFLQNGGIAGALWVHWYRMKPEVKSGLAKAQLIYRQENPKKGIPGFWKLARQDVLHLGSLSAYLIYSPHFHGLASGYILHAKEFHKKTGGWIYKKVKGDEGQNLGHSYELAPKDIVRVANYLSTHCAYERTKHSVRYIGEISYAKLGRKNKKTERLPKFCPKCGAPLIEHYLNQLTGELGDVCEQEVMEKVITWEYYKRVKKPREKKERKSRIWKNPI